MRPFFKKLGQANTEATKIIGWVLCLPQKVKPLIALSASNVRVPKYCVAVIVVAAIVDVVAVAVVVVVIAAVVSLPPIFLPQL